MIQFIKRKRVDTSLNVAPLVDIVFLLLIFFLLTSTFIHPGLELSLPEARTSSVQEQEKNVVHITKEGELYLDGEPVRWGDLKSRLQNRLAGEAEKAVVVKADQDVSFGLFVRVMDMAREVGALNLTVSTRVPEGPVDSPPGKRPRP